MTNRGAIRAGDTIVLHPFGRYSNAFKFAGEVDVLEALEHAKSQYRIDDEQIGMRGFSMGRAGCWQLAVHYADRWFAANPGAGFSGTPRFYSHFRRVTRHRGGRRPSGNGMTVGMGLNLANCPTIAYSGRSTSRNRPLT
ncbi:MAG: hypothetical protein R3B91_17685 [Planctomycetaceae bacterium]